MIRLEAILLMLACVFVMPILSAIACSVKFFKMIGFSAFGFIICFRVAISGKKVASKNLLVESFLREYKDNIK